MPSNPLWILLLCGVLWASSASAQDEYDAFVLAGQSNMVGSSTQNEDLLDGRVTSPSPGGLSSWTFRQSDHRWTLANEFPCADSQCTGSSCAYPGPYRNVTSHPVWGLCVCNCGVHIPASNGSADAGRGSAWPTFAELWMQERGRSVRFVATAIGNQCLVGSPRASQPSWNPDAMDCSTLPPVPIDVPVPSITTPGELYCRMLESVAVSGVSNLRGVLWLQGECDVGAGVSRAQYEAALERLGDAIFEDLGVPLIVAPISRHTLASDTCPAHPSFDAIHAATLDAADSHPRILLGPQSDDLALESDCTHIHDVVTLGERWYASTIAVLPRCNDGIDNDGDGLTDVTQDVGCQGPMGPTESPVCQDGTDNDGDGRIDFDGGAAANGGTPLAEADPQCGSAAGSERVAACGTGVELLPLLLALRRGWRRLA